MLGASRQQQNIARRESTDGGATWSQRYIALGNSTFHMGMARVVKAASNLYYMDYEDYGNIAATTVVSSADGKTFAGTGNA